jgi:hypothetical protein
MIMAKCEKNHAQARVSHDPLHDCQNQKPHVPLEAGRASAWGGGAHVEVDLTEGRRSNFEQFDPRASSTLKKDTTKMVNDTLGVVALELVTKKKKKVNKKKKGKRVRKGRGRGRGIFSFLNERRLSFFFFFPKKKNQQYIQDITFILDTIK